MTKIILKNMNIYLLHRSNKKDHRTGRPAILLKYKSETSLIWWGTHKKEKSDEEQPLVLKINNTKGYFYSKGIEKVNNNALKDRWINYETEDIYELNDSEQKELISTFIRFTNQNDPYQKIVALELEVQILKKENIQLRKQKEIKELQFELEND